eukprot:TRINITY_DN3926_c0_g1_i1.p1 TRINITY_DN3926_c0_g1~~TRINITY_DN3926_c0_g1_i1.p1  ORF type:complete len:451 (-),score=98.89 TRINITY_DN3926_c0_g1_i1:50-1402(-)
MSKKHVVNIEICLKHNCSLDLDVIQDEVREFFDRFSVNTKIKNGRVDFSSNRILQDNVEDISVCDLQVDQLLLLNADLRLHCFLLDSDEPVEEVSDGDEQNVTCSQWSLPSKHLNGLWESLVFDHAIKQRLLNYANTAMLFGDKRVDINLISCNRLVLLHGPPGTGKTSLCKALAHKLAIRLGYRFDNAFLLEINAHSLFSKWFSESGKLVMQLFSQIQNMIAEEDAFICVLIDEVESLTAARHAALNGTEPSDAIRVVNALLTQLDALQRRPNVMVLTTSNVTEAIDLAFVDRADIKQFIGPPSEEGRYIILQSCVEELMRVGIVNESQFDSYGKVCLLDSDSSTNSLTDSQRLLLCARRSEGLSGRTLRKVPFQAHAFEIQDSNVSCSTFLGAMLITILGELKSRKDLSPEEDDDEDSIEERNDNEEDMIVGEDDSGALYSTLSPSTL